MSPVSKSKDLKLNKNLFWDVGYPKDTEFQTHGFFIIERVLLKGGTADFLQILNYYTLEQIKEVLMKSRQISNKTRNFFAIYFKLTSDELCLPKQLNQKLWHY